MPVNQSDMKAYLLYQPGSQDDNPEELDFDYIPSVGDRIQFNSKKLYAVALRVWERTKPPMETEQGLNHVRLWLVPLSESEAQTDWSELRRAALGARVLERSNQIHDKDEER